MKNRTIVFILSIVWIFFPSFVSAQDGPIRLVVNITIDQLRGDFLELFSPFYGNGGIKRMYENGRIYEFASMPFSFPDRASATATISTGSTPSDNAIVGKSWFNRETQDLQNCVGDKTVAGQDVTDQVSAKNLRVSTISDELKSATNGSAIVYSIAPFSDASILHAGHAADGAFWIDDRTGNWRTSSYFGPLPVWVKGHNEVNALSDRMKGLTWEPLVSGIEGTDSLLNRNAYDRVFKHNFTGSSRVEKFKTSALINDEVTDLFISCLRNSLVGNDLTPDYVALTFYAGAFNGSDKEYTLSEMRDVYVRLDHSLEKILREIDDRVGLQSTLVVLTSTGENLVLEENLEKYRIPSGTFYINRTAALLNMYLMAIYGQGNYVQAYVGNEIYLDNKLVEKKHISLSEIAQKSQEFLARSSGIRNVYTMEQILKGYDTPALQDIRKRFHPQCSGDLYLEISPGWRFVNENTEESWVMRLSPVSFPLIFYGNNIQSEKLITPVTVDQIAPTIAKFLHIRAPNACQRNSL